MREEMAEGTHVTPCMTLPGIQCKHPTRTTQSNAALRQGHITNNPCTALESLPARGFAT